MRILAFVCSALVAGACLVPASAQSPSSQPLDRNYLVPHDSREQLPSFTSPKATKVTQVPGIPLNPAQKAPIKVARNNMVCYVIQSYNFDPTSSLAEMPKPAAASTCVSSTDGRVKGAASPVLLR